MQYVTSIFLSIISAFSFAGLNIKVTNNTLKPAEVAFFTAEGEANKSEVYTIESKASQVITFDQLSACRNDLGCQGALYYLTLMKWGKYNVFVRSQKIYNPKNMLKNFNYVITGNDSSALYLSARKERRHG